MTDVRYLGSSHWTRTVLDDEGKFKSLEKVAPGEVVSVDGDTAERLLAGPRYNRLFVEAGSPEDPNSEGFVAVRGVGDGGNYVTNDPGRELGSTSPDGRVIFRTEDDNPEGYPVAPSDVGPQSDNATLVENDEIEAAAEKARARARERRSSGGTKSSGSGSSSSSSDGPSSSGN